MLLLYITSWNYVWIMVLLLSKTTIFRFVNYNGFNYYYFYTHFIWNVISNRYKLNDNKTISQLTI